MEEKYYYLIMGIAFGAYVAYSFSKDVWKNIKAESSRYKIIERVLADYGGIDNLLKFRRIDNESIRKASKEQFPIRQDTSSMDFINKKHQDGFHQGCRWILEKLNIKL